MIKRVILLTLVVIIIVFCGVSCEKNREYDETEVLASAKTLIQKSEKLNMLYYGKGILYVDDKNHSSGVYYMADSVSVAEYGIQTVDDIKALTRECFTEEYSNLIIGTKLSSISDSSGIQNYARYYQKYSAIDDSPECIMVNKETEVFLKDTIVYNYSSLSVIGSEGEFVKVKIEVTVTNSDGESQTKSVEIKLLEESNGWRIDSPTYTRYVNQDMYNEVN